MSDKKRNNNKKREPKKFFKKRKKRVCWYCANKAPIDYKNTDLMQSFITDRGKIAPRRMTGCCAKHQRMVARAIKCGRNLGIYPHVVE